MIILFELSSDTNPDEIPVNVISKNQTETDDSYKESEYSQENIEELSKLLNLEKQKVFGYFLRDKE